MTEQTNTQLAPTPTQPAQLAVEGSPFVPAIAERMAKALAEVEPATLDGYHAYHKYHYTTIGQIRSLANRALARAGLSVIPSVLAVRRQEITGEKGTTILQTAVEMQFTIVGPEGRMVVQWYGESDDTSDKGLAKAISAATKSFLLNFLLVPLAEAEEEAEGARGKGAQTAHWIDRPAVRKRFWAWTGQELGLTRAEVHTALGVESVKDFEGTMEDARARITAWLATQTEGTSVEKDMEDLYG